MTLSDRLSFFRFLVLLNVMAFGGFATAQTNDFAPIDPPDASTGTHPASMNANGLITGWYLNWTSGFHGFLRLGDGQIVEFDAPGFASTFPTSINATGQVVGYSILNGGVSHAFIRMASGNFRSVDFPGAKNSAATSISNSGNIAGYYDDGVNPKHGYLRDAGGHYITIDAPNADNGTQPQAVNDSGEVAGVYLANKIYHAFFRDALGNISEFDPLGGRVVNDLPLTINASGTIAGSYVEANFATHGFIRDAAGNFMKLDVPGASNTLASAINDAGEVVGWANKLGISPPKILGFKLSPAGRFSAVEVPVDNLMVNLTALSSKGRVAGWYQDLSGIVHGLVE